MLTDVDNSAYTYRNGRNSIMPSTELHVSLTTNNKQQLLHISVIKNT